MIQWRVKEVGSCAKRTQNVDEGVEHGGDEVTRKKDGVAMLKTRRGRAGSSAWCVMIDQSLSNVKERLSWFSVLTQRTGRTLPSNSEVQGGG